MYIASLLSFELTLREKRESVQKDFVEITKLDVTLNSLPVRSKFLGLYNSYVLG